MGVGGGGGGGLKLLLYVVGLGRCDSDVVHRLRHGRRHDSQQEQLRAVGETDRRWNSVGRGRGWVIRRE